MQVRRMAIAQFDESVLADGQPLAQLGVAFAPIYLHHRYHTVNFGESNVPMDKWFGSWHDGSMEAHEAMKSRKRQSAEAGDTDAVVGDA